MTELVWGATAVLLIFFSVLPRVGAKTKQRSDHSRAERLGSTRRAEPEPWSVEREPVGARMKDAAGSFTRDQTLKNDSQAD